VSIPRQRSGKEAMDVGWVDSAAAKAVAGTFAALASVITIQHIYMQLRHFQNTKLQVYKDFEVAIWFFYIKNSKAISQWRKLSQFAKLLSVLL
jgi:hypothetical protein